MARKATACADVVLTTSRHSAKAASAASSRLARMSPMKRETYAKGKVPIVALGALKEL